MRWFRNDLVSLPPVDDERIARETWAQERVPLRVDVGARLFGRVVTRTRRDAQFRRELVREMRGVWYVLRNSRTYSVPSVLAAVAKLFDICEVFEAAGLDDDTFGRLTYCLADGCCCDGCDLYDGQRLDAWCPEKRRQGDPR